MIKLAVYVLFLFGTGYAGIIYGNSGFLLCACGGAVFAAVSYLYLLFHSNKLEVSCSIPISMTECGKTADLELKVRNGLRLPSGSICFLILYENKLTGEKGRMKTRVPAAGVGVTRILQPVLGAHCGTVLYRVKKIRFYDHSGLFYIARRTALSAELNVMPAIFAASVVVTEPARHFMGEADIYDSVKAGQDVSEVLAVRPFRNGDKIQNIHWKLSARTDELLVREPALPLGAPAVLLLELTGMKKQPDGDAFLTIAASLSFSLTEVKCPHYIAWNSSREQDVLRVRVDHEEDVYLFLLLLSEEQGTGGTSDIREAYWEKYGSEPVVTRIYLNRKLELFIGDERYTKMGKKDLERELSEVEIVV